MKGLYSSTGCVCMCMSEDGINVKIVATSDGYSGSSKDHYYWSQGKSEEASRLFCRERSCGCPPCLMLMPWNCLMLPRSGLEAGTTLPGLLILWINICGGKWLFASIWNGYLLSYLRGVVNREGIQFLPGILRKRSE